MKPEEVRERFSRHYDEEELNEMNNAYLREIGEMIEKLDLKGSSDYDKKIRRVLDEIKDSEKPTITKTKLAALLDTSLRTIYENTPNSSNDEIWRGKDEGDERIYAEAEAIVEPKSRTEKENEIQREIIEAHQKAEDILGGYRQPTLEETAYIGGFDQEDSKFREIFHELLDDKDWSKPPTEKLGAGNPELKHLIGYSAIEEREDMKFDERTLSKELYSKEKYIERNRELLEEIELQITEEDVHVMRLPDELAYFVDERNLPIKDFTNHDFMSGKLNR